MAKFSGSKWITPQRRLAIYLRDNFQCIYCGKTVLTVTLSLDHIVARSTGKNDHSSGNLITCCMLCNSERNNTEIETFLSVKHGKNSHKVAARIAELTSKDMSSYIKIAKSMIEEQNGYSQVIANLKG